MFKQKMMPLLIISLISLTLSLDFKWDTTTAYAHFYSIDQTKATKNSLDTVSYLLTSQEVPDGVSQVTMRVNTYGEPDSPSANMLMFGLITEDNKKKISVFASQNSLQFHSMIGPGFGFGRLCLEARCPTNWIPALLVAQGESIVLIIDKTNLNAIFFIPKTQDTYPFQLPENWHNKKLYFFYEANNIGCQVQIVS